MKDFLSSDRSISKPDMNILNFIVCFAIAMCAHQTSGAPQNLTTYLLTRYSSTYHSSISSPAFFHEVINGTVPRKRVAYFFEQDTIYGRGFTGLCGNTLNLLTQNLTAPTSKTTLTAIDNLGQTASGLADEDGKLTKLRNELDPGSANQSLVPSKGTLKYVEYMRNVSSEGHDPFEAFLCSWTMGKVCSGHTGRSSTTRAYADRVQAFIDVWTNIKKNQKHKPNKIAELQTIIDYWSDPSYVAAIDATATLIDDWYGDNWPAVADQVFLDTLQHEDAFWVSVDTMGES
jgi:thiaminase